LEIGVEKGLSRTFGGASIPFQLTIPMDFGPTALMDVSFLQDLVPSLAEFRLNGCELSRDGVAVEASLTGWGAVCPECGRRSERIHSYYTRRIRDLPIGKTLVTYVILARKFACQTEGCPKNIFCERLEGMAPPHSRTTESLCQSHESIWLALGGEPGARLADRLSMPTSPDTLRRRVRARSYEPIPPPRFDSLGLTTGRTRRGKTTEPS
jgi:hypothetical protein